jgi:hypothetical protein
MCAGAYACVADAVCAYDVYEGGVLARATYMH